MDLMSFMKGLLGWMRIQVNKTRPVYCGAGLGLLLGLSLYFRMSEFRVVNCVSESDRPELIALAEASRRMKLWTSSTWQSPGESCFTFNIVNPSSCLVAKKTQEDE